VNGRQVDVRQQTGVEKTRKDSEIETACSVLVHVYMCKHGLFDAIVTVTSLGNVLLNFAEVNTWNAWKRSIGLVICGTGDKIGAVTNPKSPGHLSSVLRVRSLPIRRSSPLLIVSDES